MTSNSEESLSMTTNWQEYSSKIRVVTPAVTAEQERELKEAANGSWQSLETQNQQHINTKPIANSENEEYLFDDSNTIASQSSPFGQNRVSTPTNSESRSPYGFHQESQDKSSASPRLSPIHPVKVLNELNAERKPAVPSSIFPAHLDLPELARDCAARVDQKIKDLLIVQQAKEHEVEQLRASEQAKTEEVNRLKALLNEKEEEAARLSTALLALFGLFLLVVSLSSGWFLLRKWMLVLYCRMTSNSEESLSMTTNWQEYSSKIRVVTPAVTAEQERELKEAANGSWQSLETQNQQHINTKPIANSENEEYLFDDSNTIASQSSPFGQNRVSTPTNSESRSPYGCHQESQDKSSASPRLSPIHPTSSTPNGNLLFPSSIFPAHLDLPELARDCAARVISELATRDQKIKDLLIVQQAKEHEVEKLRASEQAKDEAIQRLNSAFLAKDLQVDSLVSALKAKERNFNKLLSSKKAKTEEVNRLKALLNEKEEEAVRLSTALLALFGLFYLSSAYQVVGFSCANGWTLF
uniref:Uncharacterized protein n=1 Tax=Ditylenchus dipsaci TaxID=166011 RepID=A0A915E514_9BILA